MSSCLSICNSIHRALKSAAIVAPAAVLLLILSTAFANPATAQSYTLTTLYSFAGPPDGDWPIGIVLDPQGNLYGSTQYGGLPTCGPVQRPLISCGTVFKLDTSGQETILHRFTFANGDGMMPFIGGTVIRDSQGNLYGTTFYGGDSKCFNDGEYYGCGIVFKLDPSGRETVLHKFEGPANGDGAAPAAQLVLDGFGNIYGTTINGGDAHCIPHYYEPGCGTVFKIDAAGHETVLHRFTGANGDGELPSGVILDAQGNLYGTTTAGGRYGYGTVFRVDPNGNETILYNFRGAGVGDGSSPDNGGLTRDSQGNLYGTTLDGGNLNCDNLTPGCGTVFKLSASGQETVLYRFTGTNGDGQCPFSTLVLDNAGNLYGVTAFGSSGTAFKVDASGHETVLYHFNNEEPFQLLAVPGEQGSFYGVIYQDVLGGPGSIFKLAPSGR